MSFQNLSCYSRCALTARPPWMKWCGRQLAGQIDGRTCRLFGASAITGDPNPGQGEIGALKSIVMNLAYPERG